MKTWEYEIVEDWMDIQQLNMRGDQGWELTGIGEKLGPKPLYYFKRDRAWHHFEEERGKVGPIQ